jgi:hypothetical protein
LPFGKALAHVYVPLTPLLPVYNTAEERKYVPLTPGPPDDRLARGGGGERGQGGARAEGDRERDGVVRRLLQDDFDSDESKSARNSPFVGPRAASSAGGAGAGLAQISPPLMGQSGRARGAAPLSISPSKAFSSDIRETEKFTEGIEDVDLGEDLLGFLEL